MFIPMMMTKVPHCSILCRFFSAKPMSSLIIGYQGSHD